MVGHCVGRSAAAGTVVIVKVNGPAGDPGKAAAAQILSCSAAGPVVEADGGCPQLPTSWFNTEA